MGTACEYLTITSKSKEEGVLDIHKRKGIIISGRVHPGETVGSFMMKGVLDFLTNPYDKEAKLLRENFVFKVIPMLNPDGVINGNYRCSLAGCDLNRRWKNPSKLLHPTVYYTKKLCNQINAERGVLMFCDLHGHSRK
jgi:murein tripeptide amidase MpaA